MLNRNMEESSEILHCDYNYEELIAHTLVMFSKQVD
jgi:hypothetical protein